MRPGGTTFYFITDGIESALGKARDAAGDNDIRISGGADTIRQYLRSGHIDEFSLHTAPMLLGSGKRLFEDLDIDAEIELTSSSSSQLVTHTSYRIIREYA